MSWNASGEFERGSISPEIAVWNKDTEGEQREQVDAVTRAAEELSLVVGRPGDRIVVTMAGHANPGHAPRSGWANETVTVTVSAIPAVPA